MASIQKSFEYKGDVNQISFKNIIMEVKIPLFSYALNPDGLQEDSDRLNFQREENDFSIIQSKLKLSSDEYWVRLPIKKIIGINNNSKYGFFRYHEIERIGRNTIDAFVFDTTIITKDNFGNEIKTILFETIFGIKLTQINNESRNYFQELDKYLSDYGSLESPNLINIEKLIKNEGDRVFLINKNAFDTLKEGIIAISRSTSDLEETLLLIIEGLVDLNDDYPRLIRPIESNIKDWLMDKFIGLEVEEDSQEIIRDLIFERFNTLFDFPVSIPKIDSVEVKGTFIIKSEDEVKESYLGFYNLSVEYLQANEEYRVLRYDWSEHAEGLVDNSTPISFTQEQPIITNSIVDSILVQVTGFDGTLLWSETYYPDDVQLQNLEIEVPLLKPVTVSREKIPGILNFKKKLNGKVITMNGKCKVEDATVVIQAKREEDTI